MSDRERFTPSEPQSRSDRVEGLVQRLVEIESELQSLLGQDIDIVLDPAGNPPMLLRPSRQALLESGDHLRQLFVHLPLPLCELAPNGTILFANEAITPLTGYSPAELRGKNWWSTFFPGERLPDAFALLRELRSRIGTRTEVTLTAKDGAQVAVELISAHLCGPEGDLQGYICLSIDLRPYRQGASPASLPAAPPAAGHEAVPTPRYEMTEIRSRVEEPAAAWLDARSESPVQVVGLATALASVFDGIAIFDTHGKLIRMNPSAEALLGSLSGRTMQEVESLMRLLDGRALAPDELPLRRALRGETIVGNLLALHLSEDRTLWVAVSAAPLCSPDGAQAGVVLTMTDITTLYDLHQQQEVFVHTISHDLRSPLSVIQGHAQLLGKHLLEGDIDDAVRQSLAAIHRGVRRMEVMIEDLVDAARLEGGALHLKRRPVAIGTFIHDLLKRSETVMETARVQVRIPADLPLASADVNRLERILMNLLSNALKYSPPDSPVTVVVTLREPSIAVSVSDQGQGIDPEDLPLIFERFHRMHTPRREESIGLGLYITRMLVEAHGGEISVESVPGQGSTFTFSLPLV
ncbi:MAG: sensor histidine kinase [Armatimonadota bacterium]